MTTGKTIALTILTFVDKVMSLLFNMLSRLLITFLPKNKCLLISWLQSPSAAMILESAVIREMKLGQGGRKAWFSFIQSTLWYFAILELVAIPFCQGSSRLSVIFWPCGFSSFLVPGRTILSCLLHCLFFEMFIYLAVLGFSCGTPDLCWVLQDLSLWHRDPSCGLRAQ